MVEKVCLMTTDPSQAFNSLVVLDTSGGILGLFRGGCGSTNQGIEMGWYLSPSGDANKTSTASYRTYGVLWGDKFQNARLNNPVKGPPDSFQEYGVAFGGGDFLHPNSSLGRGVNSQVYSRYLARSGSGVGDLDQDGFDDYAVVYWRQGLPPEQHEVRVYSGKFPGNILVDTIADWQGLPFIGTCDDPPIIGADYQYTTTVARLGDLDLDGVSDFGVVTGVDTGGSAESDMTLILTFGKVPTQFDQEPVPPPPGIPAMRGNRYVQREPKTAGLFNATRIVIRVENGVPGEQADLYEGTSFAMPFIPMCGGFLQVNDPNGPDTRTFNADGVATFIYYRDATQVPVAGSKLYFQAVAHDSGPPVSCAISQLKTVKVIDSSNPYQALKSSLTGN